MIKLGNIISELLEEKTKPMDELMNYFSERPLDFDNRVVRSSLAQYLSDDSVLDSPSDAEKTYNSLDTQRQEDFYNKFTDAKGDDMLFDPAYKILVNPTQVEPSTLLVRFTGDGQFGAVQKNGFDKGTSNLDTLHSTRNLNTKTEKGGYVFGYVARSKEALNQAEASESTSYGANCIFFRTPAIKVFHRADNESQVIFNGADADPKDMIFVMGIGEGLFVNMTDGYNSEPMSYQAVVVSIVNGDTISEGMRGRPDNWDGLLAKNEMLEQGVELVKELEEMGGEAYIVGGAARDIIIGTDIKDVDIATNVEMNKIKTKFKWNPIGQSQDFGIIMVHFGGFEYEVASFRAESGSSDSRRPDVVDIIQSFEDDSKRRDFTINALGINKDGELVDYHEGIEDIEQGIIKAVGEPIERFSEDALRILRGIRFAVKYGFEIEAETKKAMIELNQTIRKLSAERISDELFKIAGSGKKLSKYIEKLDEVGLLDIIIPELSALKGKEQNPEHHPEGDAFNHTLRSLEQSRSDDPTTNIAIAFHDLGKAESKSEPANGYPTYHGHARDSVLAIENIAKRLKWSNKIKTAVAFGAENHMKGHSFDQLSNKKLFNIVSDPNWDVLKEVIYADQMSRGDVTNKDTLANIQYAEDIVASMNTGGNLNDKIKERINGNLVSQITGLRQGRELGDVLKAVVDWAYNIDLDTITDEDIVNKIREVYSDQVDNISESRINIGKLLFGIVD